MWPYRITSVSVGEQYIKRLVSFPETFMSPFAGQYVKSQHFSAIMRLLHTNHSLAISRNSEPLLPQHIF